MVKALIMRLVSLVPGLPPLQAVQLEDGQIGATLRSLCMMLQLNVLSQQRRIARSRTLRGALTTVTVATRGGPQEMAVLLAWAIPLWALGIQTNRLDAAKRARILIIQTQAVQALYQAFWDVAVPPSEEAIEGEILSEDTLDARLEARLAAIEAALPDKAALEARLKAIEAALPDKTPSEARLAAIEATVRDLAGRAAADERLLAAAIERLLDGQHSQRQRALQQEQKQPDRQRRGGRQRSRPRRGNSDKR